MKIKQGFEVRNVCGDKIVIGTGETNIDFTKTISLNESANFLWEQMQGKDFSVAYLQEALCTEYEITPEKALEDVNSFIEALKEVDVID